MSSKHLRGLIYTSLGLNAELLFTGLRNFPTCTGESQLWVAPLYYFGSLYVFEPLYLSNPKASTIYRMFKYAVSFLLIEYVAGFILKKIIGVCPWDYGNRVGTLSGYANLTYAPLWGLLGLAGERVYHLSFRLLK